jgi:hypothetical protein
MNTIIINSLAGALFFGIFTYLVNIFETHPHYLKIGAFLWAAPLFFFMLIYISSSKDKAALKAFLKHALLGTILTVGIFIFTLSIYHIPFIQVVLLNILLICLAVYAYFYFKVFEW